MYAERFGSSLCPATRRRHARNARLIERRLALFRELESVAAERPDPGYRVEGWLPQDLAAAMPSAGLLTLADLRQRIERGGRWWRGLPLRGFGPKKAANLARHVGQLLGPPSLQLWDAVTPAPRSPFRTPWRQSCPGGGGRNRRAA